MKNKRTNPKQIIKHKTIVIKRMKIVDKQK